MPEFKHVCLDALAQMTVESKAWQNLPFLRQEEICTDREYQKMGSSGEDMEG